MKVEISQLAERGFFFNDTGLLHVIEGIIHGAMYQGILKANLFSSVQQLGFEEGWIFQDNNLKYIAGVSCK